MALDALVRVRTLGARTKSLKAVVLLLVLVEAVADTENQYEYGEPPQYSDPEAAALPAGNLFFEGFQGVGGH